MNVLLRYRTRKVGNKRTVFQLGDFLFEPCKKDLERVRRKVDELSRIVEQKGQCREQMQQIRQMVTAIETEINAIERKAMSTAEGQLFRKWGEFIVKIPQVAQLRLNICAAIFTLDLALTGILATARFFPSMCDVQGIVNEFQKAMEDFRGKVDGAIRDFTDRIQALPDDYLVRPGRVDPLDWLPVAVNIVLGAALAAASRLVVPPARLIPQLESILAPILQRQPLDVLEDLDEDNLMSVIPNDLIAQTVAALEGDDTAFA